ncbi:MULTISPECIES: single-stranded DNA-binding protein [Kandleria]|jgi:single-stranded DNA-binding protein|uniref:Single-stranded DNA-binding protein n=2 Tax=Kandleria vitulina TaxID=1630 RepID=A0A0R2HEY4_9FIRM|nr:MULTISPECIES: single-stranded DNA-binding protein [Kandleria]KRN51083.1 hypothetical protein IV49_GL001157 [Kandleria vitulina DSM 20405]MBP3276251.1 single-stranded DNA-binding protein [Kandleria sp.]SDL52326.1 Single-strand binding protein family protein [Kandleria vitulina]SDW17315.1 Single-strand binding protein family protein [Kandleria vitulina]SEI76282.1 Single-strand binding protein family protein [Kandleria vitulina]
MFNEVFLIGRLVDVPDFKILQSPHGDALFHLKVGLPYDMDLNSKPEEIVSIVCWHSLAEMIKDICQPGSFISVKGRLMNMKGQPLYEHMYITYIKAETIRVLDEELKSYFLK